MVQQLGGSTSNAPPNRAGPSAENETSISPNVAQESTGDLPFRWRVISWAIALGVGLLRAIDSRFSMTGDGPRYIEMGEAYLRGDWKMAINSYWSPLYSLLIVLPKHIFNLPLRLEPVSIHLVNFIIYVCALCSLEFFLNALIACPVDFSEGYDVLQPYAMRLIGYSLFLYSALNWLSTDQVTPDLCVECVVFLIVGIILRIRREGATWARFALLGLLFGIGYLTKVFLLPLAFVFLLASLIAARDFRKSTLRALLSIFVLALVSGPYMFVLSRRMGRFTYGDAGKIAYAILVDGLPAVHWQGQASVAGTGSPVHPTRKLLNDPPLYEFAGPIGGSYPAGYDPAYWYEGVKPRFSLGGEIAILHKHLHVFYDLLFAQGEFLAAFFALYLFAPGFKRFAQHLLKDAHLWGPAVCAVGAYSLILIETRYLSGFLVILWLALFRSISIPRSVYLRTFVWCITFAVVLTIGVRVLRTAVVEGGHVLGKQTNIYWELAERLHQLGVHPGDRVASIGMSWDDYWAHLAGVTIIAEIPESGAGTYWVSDPDVKATVFKIFSQFGAKAVISNRVPMYTSPPGWTKIDDSEFFVRQVDH
jgi:hypothetical protein